jgi:hypothetical protein
VIGGDGVNADDVIDLLGHLVDKSLISAEDHEEVTRYRMSETIRQYAQERLEAAGEAEVLRRRHAEHYVAFATEAGVGLRSAEEVTWSARVESELDNLRGALAWSVAAGDADLALRLVAPLGALAGTSVGYATGPWADPVLALSDAPGHRLYPEVMAWAGWAAVIAGDVERGVELTHQALELASARSLGGPSLCHVFGSAVGVAGYAADGEEAARLAEDWLVLARSLGDDYEVAGALLGSAMPFMFSGDVEGTLVRFDEAMAAARHLGCPTLLSYTAVFSARYRADTDPVRAQELFDEALEAAASVGNHLATNLALEYSALMHFARGHWKEAARRLLRVAEEFHRLGDSNGLRTLLVGLVPVLATAGAERTAVMTSGAARVEPATGTTFERFVETVATLRGRIGAGKFEALAAQGAALDDDQVVALVRREVASLLTENNEELAMAGPGDGNEFRREGDTWLLVYENRSCRLRDAKGLRYLAALLAQQGHEVHVFDLLGSGISGGGTMEALDTKAKADYRRRLSELESD